MRCLHCRSDPCRYAAEVPTTTHGVKCSSTLARRYAYLHVRGIPLFDWSTDVQVAAHLPAIESAVADAADPDLAEDLACLLARVPSARAVRGR